MLTTGEILKEKRQKKGLSYDQIEKETKIRKKHLKAIEENDWTLFPSKTYIIGIIKSYGRFLNLEEEKLIAFFRRQYEKKEAVSFKRRVGKDFLIPQTKKIFKVTVALVSALFLFYFAYQLKLYFSPPKVEVLQPKRAVFEKDKIKLVGKTEKEAIVNVNGERVYLKEDDTFAVDIPLTKPKNEVVIEVTGANGKKTVVRKVFERKL